MLKCSFLRFHIRFLFEVVVSTDLYRFSLFEIAACLLICLVDESLCLVAKYFLKIHFYRFKILLLPWKTILIFSYSTYLYALYSIHSYFDTRHWSLFTQQFDRPLFNEAGLPHCINTLESYYFTLFIYFSGFRGVRDGVKGYV